MDEREIGLTFADGETMHFAAIPGETVLASAERAGNLLASQCRQGTCRTCAASDSSGNEVLLCQLPAQAGFKAKLPYRRADVVPPTLRRAKINSFERVSSSVWEIRYRLQFPLAFLPGQYVEASFPGIDAPRRFSMANPPNAKEQIFHVRDLPGGGMASYLGTRAKAEDAFTVRGPFGVFYLRSTAKPKLFVAGGTGLAPILSMLATIDASTSPSLALIAGFSQSKDAYAIEAINKLAARLPLEVVVTADRAAETWGGAVGNAVSAIARLRSFHLTRSMESYLCGPPAMVHAARAALLDRGAVGDCIFNEEFSH